MPFWQGSMFKLFLLNGLGAIMKWNGYFVTALKSFVNISPLSSNETLPIKKVTGGQKGS